MGQTVFRGLLGLACLFTASTGVKADYYADLTGGSDDWISGAYFNATTEGAGSGTFPAFLQAQGNDTGNTDAQPVSEAYNTTVNGVLDNGQDNNHNKAILVSNLVKTMDADGNEYFEFLWDINEPNTIDERWLSLDRLVVLTNPTPNLSEPTIGDLEGYSGSEVRYDMGTTNHVLLDANLFAGSGYSDLRVYIPVWDGYDTPEGQAQYVYLYSLQGATGTTRPGDTRDFSQTSGFDEWGLRAGATPPDIPIEPQGVVPEPTSLALAGFAGIGLALRALRRRRTQPAEQAA